MRSIERTALQAQCLDNFWTSLLPNGLHFPSQAARYSTAGWTGVVQELDQQDSLVRLALRANALGALAKQSGQQSLTVEGWRVYGKCLQMLARSMPAKCNEKSNELLATSTLLAEYELLEGARNQYATSASGDRWFRHTSGEEAIILSTGPEHYVKGHAHRLFIDTRLHLAPKIYPHVRNRTRSPFSTYEWKTVPWTLHPKDPKNELLDILIEIPAVLEDLEELLHCPEDDTDRQISLHESLEERCWILDSQLQQWSVTSGSPTISFVESLISKEYGDASTPSSLEFAMAHLGLLYWTTCLLLYQNLCRLSTCTPTELPESVEPRQYVRKMLRLMPYFHRRDMGEFIINITTFPAINIARFLDRNDPPDNPSEERRMLLKAFRGKYQRWTENMLGSWPSRGVNRHWFSYNVT
ncbi:hypothetical protein H2200_000678 [Cladophialophora chaetospira]|uniref:Uncharacterized protein n=1 Tax=Cladophialophora chaetospira TaxID=386627 RepID=A0AA39CR71_9EURO|nr:hypothetical protein H2200_000678 [Cladophialophora chaetospira]